jgi:hypothetical protein
MENDSIIFLVFHSKCIPNEQTGQLGVVVYLHHSDNTFFGGQLLLPAPDQVKEANQ